MLCNHPLDKEQLLLFLDELETLDFPSLSFEELTAIATEIVNLLKTPEGNLKSAGISLKDAIKNLETAFANLSTASIDYNNLLEELVTHLTRQLETVSKEEYLTAEAFLSSVTKSALEEQKSTYRTLLGESHSAWGSYRKTSINYCIINSLPHITQFALSSLLDSENPLTLSPQEPLREKAHELRTSYSSLLTETDEKIQTLQSRHLSLKSKKTSLTDNLAFFILIMALLTSIPTYLMLCGPKKECEPLRKHIILAPLEVAIILAVIAVVNIVLEETRIIANQTEFRGKVAAFFLSNISPQFNRIHRKLT